MQTSGSVAGGCCVGWIPPPAPSPDRPSRAAPAHPQPPRQPRPRGVAPPPPRRTPTPRRGPSRRRRRGPDPPPRPARRSCSSPPPPPPAPPPRIPSPPTRRAAARAERSAVLGGRRAHPVVARRQREVQVGDEARGDPPRALIRGRRGFGLDVPTIIRASRRRGCSNRVEPRPSSAPPPPPPTRAARSVDVVGYSPARSGIDVDVLPARRRQKPREDGRTGG